MGQPVVHFEVIGTDPAKLPRLLRRAVRVEFDTSGPVAPTVSQRGNYGFTDTGAAGIPGGIGGGPGYDSHVIFYVGVPDVKAALRKAESLGGSAGWGLQQAPGGNLVVGATSPTARAT